MKGCLDAVGDPPDENMSDGLTDPKMLLGAPRAGVLRTILKVENGANIVSNQSLLVDCGRVLSGPVYRPSALCFER